MEKLHAQILYLHNQNPFINCEKNSLWIGLLVTQNFTCLILLPLEGRFSDKTQASYVCCWFSYLTIYVHICGHRRLYTGTVYMRNSF